MIYLLFSQFLSLLSIPVVKTVVLSTVSAHLYCFTRLLTGLADLHPPLSNSLSTQQLQCPLINTNQSGTFSCTKPFNWFLLHLRESPTPIKWLICSKVYLFQPQFYSKSQSFMILLKVLRAILNIYFLKHTAIFFLPLFIHWLLFSLFRVVFPSPSLLSSAFPTHPKQGFFTEPFPDSPDHIRVITTVCTSLALLSSQCIITISLIALLASWQ